MFLCLKFLEILIIKLIKYFFRKWNWKSVFEEFEEAPTEDFHVEFDKNIFYKLKYNVLYFNHKTIIYIYKIGN